MLNLNDGRWGRGDEPASGGDRQGSNRPDDEPAPPPSGNNNQRPRGQGPNPNPGPPDLDELWRDFNRKLGGLFGGNRNGGNRPPGGGNGGGLKPDMKNAGFGLGLVAAVAVLIWLGTGFFIVNEGQQAVITQFGRYKSTVGAGFNWRLPYPIQRHELVVVTQIRSTVDLGAACWPLFVIVPGLALMIWGVSMPGREGAGLAVGGGITTVVGLILAVQNATDLWATWAYAWALVGPGGSGIGLFAHGIAHGDAGQRAAGIRSIATGLALFAAFALFFEGLIGLSGRPFLSTEAGPIILIGLGVVVIAFAVVRGRTTPAA